jgi:hypothetical protein
MKLKKSKLYLLISIACTLGYAWIIYACCILFPQGQAFTVCLIKRVANIPCPACGTTRAVVFLVKGEFMHSFVSNPFGILIAGVLTLCPIWILSDVVRKKESFLLFYKKTESFFQNKTVAIPSFILVAGNWIWNIYKQV